MENTRKKKLLWMSDGPMLQTGYATISRKLLNYLSKLGWECHFLAHTHQTATLKPGTTLEDGEVLDFYIHGAGMHQYCSDIVVPKIRDLKPDVFGVLLDTFMCYQAGYLNLDLSPAKSVFYYPSDGGGKLDADGNFVPGKFGFNMPLNCELILKKFENNVAMARFGQKQVEKVHGMKTHYIPHAIEPSIYYPLSQDERNEIRKTMIVETNTGVRIAGALQGKFVVGVVARNQGRKMLDRTFAAVAQAAKVIPNLVLLLHTDKNDPATYFNADKLVEQLGLQNRVFFTGMRFHKGANYKDMNNIYNAMDVFFLGTSGEGFGIPIIEAMACEIPVLATDYTTTWELVERNKAGEAVKLSDEILGTWNVARGVMSIDDGAEKIIKLFNNPELRKEYGKNGREAVLREYSWEKVAKDWDEYLTSLIK